MTFPDYNRVCLFIWWVVLSIEAVQDSGGNVHYIISIQNAWTCYDKVVTMLLVVLLDELINSFTHFLWIGVILVFKFSCVFVTLFNISLSLSFKPVLLLLYAFCWWIDIVPDLIVEIINVFLEALLIFCQAETEVLLLADKLFSKILIESVVC